MLEQKPSNEYVLNFAFFSFIGFVAVQTMFALLANSQAMLADSEAMSVDALTYLFNLWAERIKNQPITNVPDAEYRRELRRLYLELVPPLISVTTLVGITFYTVQDALSTLRGKDDGEDVSVVIMLVFSAANLLLDIVNVTCFARADSVFLGTRITPAYEPNETSALISTGAPLDDQVVLVVSHKGHHHRDLVNLNMCSAWTHVCADTMRSTAVLIAAGIAFVCRSVSGETADSVAALVVSLIILVSLIPLVHGLFLTAMQIHRLHRDPSILDTGVTVVV